MPDLTAAGDGARAEIEKVTIHRSGQVLGLSPWVQVGPDRLKYSLSSARELIAKVSPDANRDLDFEQGLRLAQIITLGASVALMSVASSNQDISARDGQITVALLGLASSVGMGVIWYNLMSTVTDEYNQDLRRKFTPGLTLSGQF